MTPENPETPKPENAKPEKRKIGAIEDTARTVIFRPAFRRHPAYLVFSTVLDTFWLYERYVAGRRFPVR